MYSFHIQQSSNLIVTESNGSDMTRKIRVFFFDYCGFNIAVRFSNDKKRHIP